MKRYLSFSHWTFYLVVITIILFCLNYTNQWKDFLTPFVDTSITIIIAFSALVISVTNLIKGGKSKNIRKKVSRIVVEIIIFSFFLLLLKLSMITNTEWVILTLLITSMIVLIILTAEIIAIFKDVDL